MSIDKEFVPYQESLELKELEFDEPCFGYYDLDGLQISRHHWYPQNKNSSFPLPHTTNNPKISAPTFSQAFDFFREKYEYGSLIRGRKSMGFEYILSDVPTKLSKRDTVQSPHVYETYEEAKIACLRKLIEIVKQKS